MKDTANLLNAGKIRRDLITNVNVNLVDFKMFSIWVIFYSILLVEFSTAANNNTANDVIAIRKTKYDRLLVLRRNYWKVKSSHDLIKQHLKRQHNIDKNMQRNELKKCRIRLQNEKDEFETKLANIKSEINWLTRYRFFGIVKNQIAEYDLLAIDFVPRKELVLRKSDPFNKCSQSEEIRRQRWNHLFELEVPQVGNLIRELASNTISYSEFSKRIARGYELLSERLKVNELHEVDFLETLPDFNQTIVGDPEIDQCLLMLMKHYDNGESIIWQD